MMKMLKNVLAAAFVLAALAVASRNGVTAQGPPPMSCGTGDSLECLIECTCHHMRGETCVVWECESFYWPDV